MRFVIIIILLTLSYFIVRYLVRMLAEAMRRPGERGDYEHGNRRHVSTEEGYREILGITEKDSPETIKTRYRELLMKYHPDKVHHLGAEFQEMAEKKTKAITEAYQFFQKKYNL